MNVTQVPLATAVVLILTAPFNAQAEYLRCKNDLVEIGDSKSTVQAKCGEPMAKDFFCRPLEQQSALRTDTAITTIQVASCETVDTWTYNPGPGQFFTTLRFEQGELKSMEYGGRVP